MLGAGWALVAVASGPPKSLTIEGTEDH